MHGRAPRRVVVTWPLLHHRRRVHPSLRCRCIVIFIFIRLATLSGVGVDSNVMVVVMETRGGERRVVVIETDTTLSGGLGFSI